MSVSTGTVYDAILGSANSIQYTDAPSFGPYPESSMFSLMGPVYAPRLYASKLDTLDLGSSGKVTFSLTDAQRLNLSQESNDTQFKTTSSNNLVLTTSTGTSLLRLDSNGAVAIAGQSNVTVSSSNAILATAGSALGVNVASSNSTLTIDSAGNSVWKNAASVRVGMKDDSAYLDRTASNAILYAATKATVTNKTSNAYAVFQDTTSTVFNSNQVYAQTVGATLKLTAADKTILATSDSNIVSAAVRAQVVAGAASNAWLDAGSDGTIAVYSSNLIQANTTTFNLGVKTTGLFSHSNSNAFVKITDGFLELVGTSNLFRGSNIDVSAVKYTLSNTTNTARFQLTDSVITQSAKSNWIASTESDALLLAGAASNAYVRLNSNGTLTAFGSSAIQGNAPTINLGASTTALVSHSNSNAFVKITDGFLELVGTSNLFRGSNIDVSAVKYTLSNTTNTARFQLTDSVITQSAKSNWIASTESDALLLAGAASNAYVRLNSNGALAAFAEASVTCTTNAFTAGASNVTLNVGDTSSNAFVTLSKASSNARIFGKTDVVLAATSTSNAYVQLDTNGSTVFGATTNVMALTGSNVFLRQTTSNSALFSSVRTELSVFNSNAWIRLDKDSGLTMSASNAISLLSSNVSIGGSNVSIYGASSNTAIVLDNDDINFKGPVNFQVASNTVFQVKSNGVYVKGSLQIDGSIDSVNITQYELSVLDKKIFLSDVLAGDAPVADGFLSNHESGMQVQGLNSGFTGSNDKRNQKSFFWMYGDNGSAGANGLTSVLSANPDKESYWELIGGGLRLTGIKNAAASQKISYAMRINESDEMEFVKISFSNNAYTYKRIAKFGVTR